MKKISEYYRHFITYEVFNIDGSTNENCIVYYSTKKITDKQAMNYLKKIGVSWLKSASVKSNIYTGKLPE